MGSIEGRPDERPVHRVELGAFRLGRTPVTNAQYAPFLSAGGAQPSEWWSHPAFSDPRQPVVGVTWFDAVAYTEWLCARTGGCFRLPTEAEWEAAARGGLLGAPTAWGNRLPEGEVPAGPLEGPWLAGQGEPNGYGLCDMGTIVHEWCFDWYRADAYASSAAVNPRGPEEGERRVSRGGSWRHQVRYSSPANRSSLPPGFRYSDYGFRVLEEIQSTCL
jgi:formylglycine-generating enzyme required for sulfatase activity